MRKILFFTNQIGGGGSERVLTMIANNLSNNVNNKVFIRYFNDTDNKYYINECIDLKKINNTKVLKQIVNMNKEIKKINPDVIISFEYHMNIKTLIGAYYTNAKVIVSERNDPAQQNNRILIKKLRDYLYKRTDVLVCQTNDAKSYFSEKIQKKSIVIPNPVKSNLPKYIGENDSTIINFCRLEPQKNLKLLIDSVIKVHDINSNIKLEIYGNGSEKSSIINYIKNKNANDYIFLYDSVDNIHEIASKRKMFVSSSNYEGLSNSMLEAMAMGMPVICTNCPCGGAKMMIQNDNNGVLVPLNDSNAMSEAILKIFENKNFSRKISQNASKIAKKFSEENILKEWKGIIEC